MFNLPTDTAINGLRVLHEGNHFDNGDFHPNYLSKYSFSYTLNTKDSNTGNYCKIATIQYIPNVNVVYRYDIELFTTNITELNMLTIFCENDLSNTKVNFKGDTNINIVIKQKSVNENNLIDVYVQINRSWTKLFYRCYIARCLDYLSLYDEKTAYNSLKLFNEQQFVQNMQSDVNVNYVRNEIIKTITTQNTTVNANSDIKLQIPVEGLTRDCLVSYIPTNADIPAELSFNSCYIPYSGYLILRVKNSASYNKDLPKITWNISYRRLS